MTDEAKPPKKKPGGGARRPRTPRAKQGAKPEAEGLEAPTQASDASDAEPTEVTVGPDAEPTQAIGGPDAEPTQVIDGADAEPTQRLGGPPPPAYTPLPKVATPSSGGERRGVLWAVVVVAAIAALAVVLVWAFAVRDTGDYFIGTWAPATGEGGGFVIARQDGSFEVTAYSPDLTLVGTFPAARDGDTLTFRLADEAAASGLLEARLTYVEDRDVLLFQAAGMGVEGAGVEYVRVDELQAAPPPTPPPATPTPTPTSSPTASPTGTPTPSPTGTDTAANDQAVVDGIISIQVGILDWRGANGAFPPPEEVAQSGGVGEYVSPWPTNPFTGQPMAPGDQPGDYTYEQLSGGQGYRLVGHLANGFTFTVP